MSNYATKKGLDHATGVHTSDLAAKNDFIPLKAEIEKLGINKLVNAPTISNNLKTKVNDLYVGKLKTVIEALKKLNDKVENKVVKNVKFNTIKTKVNNLEKNILIHINQYNTDKHIKRKKKKMSIKIPSGLVSTTVLNTKISEVENKIPDISSLVTTTVLNTKISEVENKIPDHAKYITTQKFGKLTVENFAARLKQADLVGKTDSDNKLISLNRKITSNKTKLKKAK